MNTVPQIVPISQMRLDQAAVLEQMEKAPVILAARSHPRAVLVAVEQWDQLVNRLHQLEQRERARIADEHFQQMRAGEYVELTSSDIESYNDASTS